MILRRILTVSPTSKNTEKWHAGKCREMPGICRESAGTLPGSCRESAGKCRQSAGKLPGRCRESAGKLPVTPVPVAGKLPGRCRALSQLPPGPSTTSAGKRVGTLPKRCRDAEMVSPVTAGNSQMQCRGAAGTTIAICSRSRAKNLPGTCR